MPMHSTGLPLQAQYQMLDYNVMIHHHFKESDETISKKHYVGSR